MINQQLYIGDDMLDLYKKGSKSFIATTIAGFNIGNIRVRDAHSTNKITVPPTNNNKKLLGLEDEHSTEITPYRKKKARLVQNGVEIIPNGVAVVLGFNGLDFELNIFSGIYDLFQKIDNLNVDDIDFGDYQIVDDTYIESIRLPFIGLTPALFAAPVLDWGNLFPSNQIIKNSTFTDDTSPWTNETRAYPLEITGTSGDDWTLGGGAFFGSGFSNRIGYTAFNAGAGNLQRTNRLQQAYKFFTGFKYRIQLTVYCISSDNPFFSDVRVDARTLDNTTFKNVIASAVTLNSEQIIENTFTADRDYDWVEITAQSLTIGSDLINLLNIKITAEAGIVDIKAATYIPLISYSRIIKQIINNAGYTLNLDLQNYSFYERLYLAFSKAKYEYPESLIDKMIFNYSVIGNISRHLTLNSVTKRLITFDVKNKQGAFGWYNGHDTYNVPVFGYNVSIIVRGIIIVNAVVSGTDNIGLFFQLDGVTQTQTETITATGTYVFTFESHTITAGLTALIFNISANRSSGSGTNTLTIVSGNLSVDIAPGAFGTINLSALVLPTVSQKAFLTDFFYRFGILAEESNGVITCTEINQTIKRRLSKDWTLKRDHNIIKAVDYTLSNYGQKNIFTDIIDDKLIVQDSFSSLDIDNDTLPVLIDYYTSIMSECEQNLNNGIQLCRINFFDKIQADGIGTFDTNPRLFYLRTPLATDSPVKFNGVVKASYFVAVYNDPLSDAQTTWKYFLAKYYPLITTALQKAKTTTDYFTLNDVDIANLSISQLIFDNGVDYIIVGINDYIPGQKTKVDLFKVS